MADPASQDGRYEAAAQEFGAALERLARAYEPDPDKRRDLLQEITRLSAGHVATKVHRIKQLLARRFHQGASYGG
jgi:hypothetical protein